jgi:HEAT repeat protein
VSALAGALKDSDAEVARLAAAALGAMGSEAKDAAEALRKARGHPARVVRRAAAEALKRVER